MDKRGDIPFWLVMTIFTLLMLVVILVIIGLAGGKLQDFVSWLGDL